MPGARLQSFRVGDVAEAMAGVMLKRIAFVTPVPRDEDVGHDFICAISERDGKLVKAGPSFTIQVKSNNKPIVYEMNHAINWIQEQENPFFVAVCDVKSESLEIFSTWKRLKAFLMRGGKPVRLIPKSPKKGKDDIQWIQKGGRKDPQLDIYLGKPILKFSSKGLVDKNKADSIAAILKEWILLDRENIVRRAAKMYRVTGPRDYVTNKSLVDRMFQQTLYFNAKNLDDCRSNFIGSAEALLSVLTRFPNPPSICQQFEMDLKAFLKNHASLLTQEVELVPLNTPKSRI